MNFHLPPLTLHDESPEVWGFPRYSAQAGLWFVDWHSAGGLMEGATMADLATAQWCEANKAQLQRDRAELVAWRLRLVGQFTDDIPF